MERCFLFVFYWQNTVKFIFWLFLAPQNSTKNYSLIASAVQVINSKRIMLFVGFCEFSSSRWALFMEEIRLFFFSL